jgi:hypothetical protein
VHPTVPELRRVLADALELGRRLPRGAGEADLMLVNALRQPRVLVLDEAQRLRTSGGPDGQEHARRSGAVGRALNNLATGLNLTVRNVATHTRDELTEQEGMERLAAYSCFARLLDQCEIRRAKEPEGT